MPLLGVAGERSWRYAWLVFPLAAALARRGRGGRPQQRASGASATGVNASGARRARLRRWLAAEALTNTAWAGTLVYSGALFVESYGASTALTGVVLSLGAGAYVSGNLALRRLAEREPRQLLSGLA